MKRLQSELLKLKSIGERSLVSEIEALMEATAKKDVPLSHKFLALAAHEINQGNCSVAHDCIGSAIEARQMEDSGEEIELTAAFKTRLDEIEVTANENAMHYPVPEVGDDEPSYEQASPETITSFADLLVHAGYAEQAKKYVETFNSLEVETTATSDEGESVLSIDRKKALKELRAGFKKSGDLAMVKAADEMLEALEEEAVEEKPAEGCGEEEKKEEGDKATAEEAVETKPEEEVSAMGTKAEETTAKKTLIVEPASQREDRLKAVAARASEKGDVKKARAALAEARSLERMRIVAALIKAGDSDLAMEGLKEEESEGQGGFSMNATDHEETQDAIKEVEETSVETEMPEEEAVVEEPTKEPEMPEEASEPEQAKELAAKVQAAVKRNKMKEAVAAFGKLTKMEDEIVAAIKEVRAAKDEVLAKEGFDTWRAVAKFRLKAEAIIAEGEGEEDIQELALEGMEDLEDEAKASEELDKALEGIEDSAEGEGEEMPVEAPVEEVPMDMTKEGEKEAEAMHYEVLQSIEEVKAMKVDRNALAFTFWEDESGSNPFYVVQAAGKPVAEIHLGDQDNAKEIKAYFCDDQKYTKALAQSVENTNLYEMLKGVHARFYANAVENTAFAKKMREEAVASVSDVRVERLSQLRKDYTDAIVLASTALNKGLYNKPNALKSAFAKVLQSYGISHPHLAVEAAFNEAGSLFFEQVLDAANEYIEMPKEALAHAKKMIQQAQNVALAQASNFSDMTLASRLAQNSLPMGAVSPAHEAPVVASSYSSERAAVDSYRSKLKLGRKF